MKQLHPCVVAAVAFLTAFATPAIAHPGHGHDGGSHTIWHYLLDPLHAGGALLLLATAFAFALYRRHRQTQH